MTEQLSLFPVEEKTVASSDQKLCKICGCYKDLDEYHVFPAAGDGRYPYCKSCKNNHSRVTRQLRKIHRIPEDHVCPVCNRSADQIVYNGTNVKSVWRIDHCHTTDEFRGWLCHTCNQALGMLNDDVPTMHRAIAYLQNGSS